MIATERLQLFHFKMLLISITISNNMLFSGNSYQDRRTVLVTNDKSLKDLLSCSIAVNDLSPFVEAPTPKSRSLCAASLSKTQIYGIIPWSD